LFWIAFIVLGLAMLGLLVVLGTKPSSSSLLHTKAPYAQPDFPHTVFTPRPSPGHLTRAPSALRTEAPI
jgi:hypothetical protein